VVDRVLGKSGESTAPLDCSSGLGHGSSLAGAARSCLGEPSARPSGPISVQLRFPDIDDFDEGNVLSKRGSTPPQIQIEDDQVVISCTAAYLRTFADPENIGTG
jgi:hypothetical protein